MCVGVSDDCSGASFVVPSGSACASTSETTPSDSATMTTAYDPNVLGDLLVPANSSVTFNATEKGVPQMTVTGRVSVNGTIIIDARTIVNTTGPYNLNVFKYSGPKPQISPDKIDVLIGNDSCLKVSNVQTNTVGDLFVVRIDVSSSCLTTQPAPPAIVDEFPIVPVAVGASVGFCLLVTLIVVAVVCVCRRRKQGADNDVDDPHAADFASRTSLTPQRDTRVPIPLSDLRAQPHNYEQTDDPLGDGAATSPLGSVYNVVSAADAAQMAPDGIYDTVGSSRKETLEYHRVGKQPAAAAAATGASGIYDSVGSSRQETLQYHRVGRGANGNVGGGNQQGTYDSVSGMVNAREANEYDSARLEDNYHSVGM